MKEQEEILDTESALPKTSPLEEKGEGETVHVPVLLEEVVQVLEPKVGSVFLDGTLGGGGHANALIPLLGATGRYIGIDADSEALQRARTFLLSQHPSCVHFLATVCANARSLKTIVNSLGVKEVDCILFDAGLSSDQLTPKEGQKGRGFSFARNEPLLMTLCANPKGETVTAREVVNEWAEESLADIIYGFGGERRARRIAHAIVEAREKKAIETSGELADIVLQAVGKGWRGIHPATKTFQAIRIAVNDELGALEEVLHTGEEVLAKGGRIAVISFHSLEDGLVKRTFAQWVREGKGRLVTKKPITASRKEQLANRRSRSAKLRCFEKW